MANQDPHDEIVAALRAVGRPAVGPRRAASLGSELEYLVVTMPALRKVARRELSFTQQADEAVLATWDRLWRESPYGEVLHAALEYYLPIARKGPTPGLWRVIRGWADRVDNWAHADALSNVYSHVLHHHHSEVFPDIERWNATSDQWLRRISLVSTIHYTGKNAVFLGPEEVLPLVDRCVADDRYYVQKAVGWVLREMGSVYPDEVGRFVDKRLGELGTHAFARAIERQTAEERSELRGRRRELRS